jgi:hypothetical protein
MIHGSKPGCSRIHEELQARLAELNSLPTSYIEPLDIKTAQVAPSLSAPSRPLGVHICAPCVLPAESLSLGRVSSWVQPGAPIKLLLAFPEYEDDCVAAQSIMRLTRVEASIRSVDIPPSSPSEQLLESTLSIDRIARAAVITLRVPATLPEGSLVIVSSITLAGVPLVSRSPFPLVIAVMSRHGLSGRGFVELVGSFGAANHTPAVSDYGVLYIPRYNSPDVLIFSDDFVPQGTLLLAKLGLSDRTRAAAVDDESQTLLLSDFSDDQSIIVSVDLPTSSVKWRTSPGDFSTCGQLAVLRGRGVFVATSCENYRVHVHRLVDGVRIASATATSRTSFVAYDAISELVFIGFQNAVWAYTWNGTELAQLGKVELAGTTRDARPMAVVPPSHTSSSHSHLVVGTFCKQDLLVLCLPSTPSPGALEEICCVESVAGPGALAGIAADAAGTSLVMCLVSARPTPLTCVAWPLEGLPPRSCY